MIPRGEDTTHLNSRGRLQNLALRAWTVGKPRRRFPPYAVPYTGSAWWGLNRQAAEYVQNFTIAHPDYRRWFERAWIPDEFFVQSIVAGTGFRGEVANETLHFLSHGVGYHPRTLTLSDLPEIERSGKLFARKFDIDVDCDVLAALSSSRAPG